MADSDRRPRERVPHRRRRRRHVHRRDPRSGADGRVAIRKLLSTPPDYDAAVVDGGRAALAADGARSTGVVHGTTVATNAVLERRGALTALVTTAGFRDVLELRRLRIPHMYDPFWRKPPPLVAAAAALRGRTSASPRTARCCAPLDEDEARAVAARLREPTASSRSRSACCTRYLLSRATSSGSARSCARSCPDVAVSLSSEILREQREYERSATTVVNAYVRPLMGALRRPRSAAGSTARASTAPLTIMQSSGGVMTAEDATRPARARARVGPGGRRRRARSAWRSGSASRTRSRSTWAARPRRRR